MPPLNESLGLVAQNTVIAGTLAAFFSLVVLLLFITEGGNGPVATALRFLRILSPLAPLEEIEDAGSAVASLVYATLHLKLDGELSSFTSEAEADLLERLAFYGGISADALQVLSRRSGSIVLEVAVMRSREAQATAAAAAEVAGRLNHVKAVQQGGGRRARRASKEALGGAIMKMATAVGGSSADGNDDDEAEAAAAARARACAWDRASET